MNECMTCTLPAAFPAMPDGGQDLVDHIPQVSLLQLCPRFRKAKELHALADMSTTSQKLYGLAQF